VRRDHEEARHLAKANSKKRHTKQEREVHKMLRNSKTDSRYATDLLTASGTFSRTASEISMEVRHHSF
jgi:DNA-binding CsgD family transcriptional regulator